MNRHELHQIIAASKLFRHWHWFHYHFVRSLNGLPHPLAESVIEACLACESISPGFAKTVIDRMAAIGGRDRHKPDWEQLLQQLAELHILNRILNWQWPAGTTYNIEPHGEGTKKNPEVVVSLANLRLGFEVKAPALFSHIENREKNSTQIASRFAPREMIKAMSAPGAPVTMPRDNPIKDYLVSAEAKFEAFCKNDENFFGVLVIVWDDFIYEPISALLQKDSGLFTPNSFYRDMDGQEIHFPSISGVVVVRHLHQLQRACSDQPLIDGCRSPLDFGQQGQFPWKAYVQNPWGPAMPQEAIAALDARPPQDDMGAEYRPQEYIMWIDLPR